jgi:putative oxidoreductase
MMDLAEKLKGHEDKALLLLRVVVAFIFLWHGVPKAMSPSMAMGKFVAMGFPGFLGPIVGIAEVIAGVLLLIGLYARWSSVVLAVIIVVAILGVQIKGGVTSGLERDLMILAGTLVLATLGPGKLSVKSET